VAAVDDSGHDYEIPVDLVIDKHNPQSWRRGAARIEQIASESDNKTAILLQQEYGLDPLVEDGRIVEARGNNYVDMAWQFAKNRDLITLVYLHTVLGGDRANNYQVRTLQNLGKYTDGLIVTTQSAVDILNADPYDIPLNKLNHIDHGIRTNKGDRLKIKEDIGAKDVFLATQLGLKSPGKGVQYTIEGVAEFVDKSLRGNQRDNFCCLVAGEYHPGFVAEENGVHYRAHREDIEKRLKRSNLRWQEVDRLGDVDFRNNEFVLLDGFLDEKTLKNFYCATNVMVMPYLEMQQISSGIGADTLGSGRVPLSTRFRWMEEMLGKGKQMGDIEVTSRGILMDPGERSVNQIAQGLDYLVFNKAERLKMEVSSYERGHQMRWEYVAGNLLRHLAGISRARKNVVGRGVSFEREKESVLNVGK